ncbi:MAG: DUF5684 domain-containing protein [Myxococcota bacterium]|nr:DUF5684 domain-containing protein [Myxococcota bacterium]
MEGGDIIGLVIGIISLLIGLAIGIVFLVGTWKAFVKAGRPGWACLVPFYNFVVMLQIAGQPIWMILGLFVPILNIATLAWIYFNISKNFGGGMGTTILLFFGIGWLILGFGAAKYEPSMA